MAASLARHAGETAKAWAPDLAMRRGRTKAKRVGGDDFRKPNASPYQCTHAGHQPLRDHVIVSLHAVALPAPPQPGEMVHHTTLDHLHDKARSVSKYRAPHGPGQDVGHAARFVGAGAKHPRYGIKPGRHAFTRVGRTESRHHPMASPCGPPAKETNMKALRLVSALLLALMAVAACTSGGGGDGSGGASVSRDGSRGTSGTSGTAGTGGMGTSGY